MFEGKTSKAAMPWRLFLSRGMIRKSSFSLADCALEIIMRSVIGKERSALETALSMKNPLWAAAYRGSFLLK
jgi:hypothetical protein